MNHATIYELTDSRQPDRVRYVGQTRIALDQRLRRHWVTALAGALEHRAVWMRSVRAAGAVVLITSVARVSSDQADSAEQEHIARCRELESAKRRGPHSPETYRKISETQKASLAVRENMARLHQRNRGIKRTPEQRERLSQSLRGEKNGQSVLTLETATVIRERYAAGAVQAHLAREFHCSPATIHGVVHRRRWVPA